MDDLVGAMWDDSPPDAWFKSLWDDDWGVWGFSSYKGWSWMGLPMDCYKLRYQWLSKINI